MADEAGEEDVSDSDIPESISGKRKRSTKAILQKTLAAELERLQTVDTTYLSVSKRASIHEAVEGAIKPDPVKGTITSSGEGEKDKTQ